VLLVNENTLISVRGWPTDLDPRYPGFVDRLRDRGLVVHDIFVPGSEQPSLEAWAAAYVDEIERLGIAPQRRQLLGYCLGGHLLLEVAHQLCARGETPRYVGLIDVRDLPPLTQVQRGIYRKYRVPLPRRIRNHARLLTGPYATPSTRAVLSVWVESARLTFGKWRARGCRPAQPEGDYWAEARLAYSATFRDLPCPVHLYNCSEAIEENLGDPTLGLAPLLRGGVALRTFDGTHLGCVEGDAAEPLVDLVAEDLSRGSTAWIDKRHGSLSPS